VGGEELLEVVFEVRDVVEDEVGEGHGGVVPDGAGGFGFVGRDVGDDVGDVEIEAGPEGDELGGIGSGVVLDGDVGGLVVAGEIETGLGEGADEALVVVGGGVDEVAEEFDEGPLAGATGGLPVAGREGGEGGLGLFDEVDEVSRHRNEHELYCTQGRLYLRGFMAALIDAISVKRRTLFEHEGVPFVCLDSDVSTPTARGGQTLVRLKVRNLLTRGVFDKTFKAGDKFKEPDLVVVSASYLYSDGEGSHFLDQESFETLTLSADTIGDATNYLVDGTIIELQKFEGNPIGIELPQFMELVVAYTEPGVKGETSSGSVTKAAKMETGLEVKVPLFIKQGEKVKVSTETGEFAGRA
jgi:elongation factor P